jgi:hypothetical protein
MSAYICNPEHFGILGAYASQRGCVISEWDHSRTPNALITNAQRVARGLARENIRSVAYRYPNDQDGDRPGPCLLDADIEEAAAIYAAHFIRHPQRPTPVRVLKLVSGLDYQSCETNDWTETLAYRQLQWIQGHAIRSLPGYDEEDWSFEQAIPEIEALYEKRPT